MLLSVWLALARNMDVFCVFVLLCVFMKHECFCLGLFLIAFCLVLNGARVVSCVSCVCSSSYLFVSFVFLSLWTVLSYSSVRVLSI